MNPEPESNPDPNSPPQSPLSEAEPDSLDQFLESRVSAVLNRTPLALSDEDLTIAVRYYRSQRAKFAEADRNRPEPKPKGPRGPVPKSIQQALDMAKVKDLDLDGDLP